MFHSIAVFLAAHPTSSALVSYYVLSAAIGSLPAPQTNSGMFYAWFFKFSNTLAGNLTRAFSTKLGTIVSAPPEPAKQP